MTNCTDEASSVGSMTGSTPKSFLLSATITKETPLEMLRTLAQMADRNEFSRLVRFSVRTYRVTYTAELNGKSVNASGLLYIPAGVSAKAPLLSVQHGTAFLKRDAPTVSGAFNGMEYFAAAGYITMMPDYIGYGESSELFHPYYDRKSSANSVINMIKAVREFLSKEKISCNNQLFLAGYSEGGYVTMAAAKELQSNPPGNLKLTAVAAGAGGYDLEAMLHKITSKTYYAYPGYLAFVLMSYNQTYKWHKPLTYFFQPKYANVLANDMDGTHDGWYLNMRLTTTVPSLLDKQFYQHIKTGNEPVIMQAMKDNSVSSWRANFPIRLYHGTNDEIISFSNSEITKEKMKAAGTKNITLIRIEGGSHGSSFVPMLEDFVPWFETLRNPGDQ